MIPMRIPMNISKIQPSIFSQFVVPKLDGDLNIQSSQIVNYKTKNLGLYFTNNNHDNYDKHLHEIYNQSVQFRYYYHTVKPNNTSDNKWYKIKKLKILHPYPTCHWDDNTFRNCDDIYNELQKIKVNIKRLKLREPIDISYWDI